MGENIDEGVLRWFGHMERMENERIAKRVYVGECAGSRSLDRPRKRWIDSAKDCLKKSGLDFTQARITVNNSSVWQRFVRGNAWGVAPGDEPLTLMKWYSCDLQQLYEALKGRNSVSGQVHNLRV